MSLAGSPIPAPYPPVGTPLSERERDLLVLLAQGHSHKTAARALNIAFNTAKTMTRHARVRIGALTTTHAVALAIATHQLPAEVALLAAANGGERS